MSDFDRRLYYLVKSVHSLSFTEEKHKKERAEKVSIKSNFCIKETTEILKRSHL